MNRVQRQIIVVGIMLFAGSLVYPPWVGGWTRDLLGFNHRVIDLSQNLDGTRSGPPKLTDYDEPVYSSWKREESLNKGYSFLWEPPSDIARIAITPLILQWAVILVATTVLALLAHRTAESKRSAPSAEKSNGIGGRSSLQE